MKYLILLLLCLSCSKAPLYKAGDCIRIYAIHSVGDFYIREVINDRYVVSGALIFKGIPSYTNVKHVFDFDEIEDRSKKIDCSKVE